MESAPACLDPDKRVCARESVNVLGAVSIFCNLLYDGQKEILTNRQGLGTRKHLQFFRNVVNYHVESHWLSIFNCRKGENL